jgi:phosphoribosylglycinamide formyltransferase-1
LFKEAQCYFAKRFIDLIREYIDLIMLAGFVPILQKFVFEKFNCIIIKTHKSLLPKYGGLSMYGIKTQESVMNSGDKVAECTIHYVTTDVDGDKIILKKRL